MLKWGIFVRASTRLGAAGMLLLSTGCNGGWWDDNSQACSASDATCIQNNAATTPDKPVQEDGKKFHALQLGNDQCNIRSAGNHIGNPLNTVTGGPTMVDATQSFAIAQPRECEAFGFFTNFCNFGVSRSMELQDIWLLSDSDMTFMSQPVTIPALDPCECASGGISVPGLPSQFYVLNSANSPGGSFTQPLTFGVPATLGGVENCN